MIFLSGTLVNQDTILWKKYALPQLMGLHKKLVFTHIISLTKKTILFFPAMGTSAHYYQPFVENLYSAGFNVISADLRGNGTSSVRSSRQTDYNYHSILAYDYQAVVDYAISKNPSSPVYLLGHSLGGQLSLIYGSINPTKISGVITLAAGSAYYNSFKFPKNILVLIVAPLIYSISKILGYFPGRRLGFAGREARGVISDMAHQARTGRYTSKNSPFNYENLLSEFQKPILTIAIMNDKIAPKNTIIHLAKKLSKSKWDFWELPKVSIEKPGTAKVAINHFNWVKDTSLIVNKISNWIETSEIPD